VKNQFLRVGEKVENFADDQYLFIFADLDEIRKKQIPRKKVAHNFLPQIISSLNG